MTFGTQISIIILIIFVVILTVLYGNERYNRYIFQQEKLNLLYEKEIELNKKEKGLIEIEKCNNDLLQAKSIQKAILDILLSNSQNNQYTPQSINIEKSLPSNIN